VDKQALSAIAVTLKKHDVVFIAKQWQCINMAQFTLRIHNMLLNILLQKHPRSIIVIALANVDQL